MNAISIDIKIKQTKHSTYTLIQISGNNLYLAFLMNNIKDIIRYFDNYIYLK